MGSGCCKDAVDDNERVVNKMTLSSSNTNDPLADIYTKIQDNYLSIPNNFNTQKFHIIKDVGISGLENLGNSCNINSILQCLFNCQPLIDYFLSDVYKKDLNILNPSGSGGDLALAFFELVNAYWTKSYDLLVPRFFVTTLLKITDEGVNVQQWDPHEIFHNLIIIMHEDLNRAGRTPLIRPIVSQKTSELIAAKHWQMELDKHCSIMVDLFQGQIRQTLSCTECLFDLQTFDIFFSLGVSFPKGENPVTLEEMLEEYIRPKEMSRAWLCPKCNFGVKAIQKIEIWKVPPILVIHLKKKTSVANSEQYASLKEGSVEKLDMSNYLSALQKDTQIYKLFAKVNCDRAAKEAHYTATTRHINNRSWQFFDDSEVYHAEGEPIINNNSLILFFQKDSVKGYYRQSKNMPKYWPHLISSQAPMLEMESLDG